MRIFTASWFFPPATSAEGLVTYKLLKYSSHTYDLCCSKSNMWGYAEESDLKADNIHVYPVETDQIDVWEEECIRLFQRLNKKYHYQYVMTRSMPPESIRIGMAVKKIHPQIRWIASLADPVYRNPYELEAYIDNDPLLRKLHLNRFFISHPTAIRYVLGYLPVKKYQLLRRLYDLEQAALHDADLIIMPSQKQMEYLMEMKQNRKYRKKCRIIPHSYDSSLYPQQKEKTGITVVITYVGYLDAKRMPLDFLQALAHLKKMNPSLAGRLHVQFVGNIDTRVQDAVNAFFLNDLVEIREAVSYMESLKLMKNSDYLLHIDAGFEFMKGGSVFCASKIMDYIGSQNKALALTDQYSEAARIVIENEGAVLERGNVLRMSETLKDILSHDRKTITENRKYSAENIARRFDELLRGLSMISCANGKI